MFSSMRLRRFDLRLSGRVEAGRRQRDARKSSFVTPSSDRRRIMLPSRTEEEEVADAEEKEQEPRIELNLALSSPTVIGREGKSWQIFGSGGRNALKTECQFGTKY